MAVNFQKGGSTKAATPAAAKAAAPATGGKPSWMKTGAAAQAALAHDEQKAAEKQAQSNKTWRIWMPVDGETKLTFLDGKLAEDGTLDVPMFLEHQLFMSGHWRNWFLCVAEDEPCPICEGGAEAKLVAVFSVIDHAEYKDKKGNLHKNEKRLLVCKRDTFKLLQKIATKRGGLAGCTFDVSRTGKNEASVGNVYDFTEKQKKSEIAAKYGLKMEDLSPCDYEKEFPYLTGKELRDMGFGGQVVGSESSHEEPNPNADAGGEGVDTASGGAVPVDEEF